MRQAFLAETQKYWRSLISYVLSVEEKPFSVISVIGKGGIGKTTIAQLVYKSVKDRHCFDLFGWVCVSEEFNVSRLIKATIESISKLNCDVSELSPLQEKLANTLKGRSVLLVLDDVWNENRTLWEVFRAPFREAKLVRILVTTRNDKIAEVMETMTTVRPTYLPEIFSWQLFQYYAFGNTGYTVPTHIIEIGRNIMRKCGGLPLALKSIASFLKQEADEGKWRDILESDLWESNPSNDILPALQISYAHLPGHLKQCFLFCSMYPKGYELEKKNLIELWISHDYIEPRGKRRITQIGVEYYEELIERSFLDDVSDESFEKCKLHHIIHDLGRLNSDNEHCSLEINEAGDIEEVSIPKKVYHLHIRGFVRCVNEVLEQNLKGLRTLSTDLRGCRGYSEHQYCINNMVDMDQNLKLSEYHTFCMRNTTIFNLTKFEALRVLELKGNRLREIPDSIGQLKHLSYLRITSHHLQMLPLSIGLLYNLQTFILDCYISPLKYVPESIGYLANLRHLCIECKIEQLPRALYSLTNLLRLVIKRKYLEEVPSDLGRLCYLEELTIGSERIQMLPDSIGCLTSLTKLELSIGDLFQDLPNAVGTLKKLKTVRIRSSNCFSISYSPHGQENFPAISTMEAYLRVTTLGWLKDMKNIEGELIIEGLGNMSNLLDSQKTNLRICKMQALVLCWHDDHKHNINVARKLKIRLTEGPTDSRIVGRDMNIFLV